MCKFPDPKQLFTPPKSKDPFTAATKGSSFDFLRPFAKPAAFLPTIGSILGTAFAGPGVGATIGTGIGALQGATTGIFGKPGAQSAIRGGTSGFSQSGIGNIIGQAGAGGGFQRAADVLGRFGAGRGAGPLTFEGFKAATGGGGFPPPTVSSVTQTATGPLTFEGLQGAARGAIPVTGGRGGVTNAFQDFFRTPEGKVGAGAVISAIPAIQRFGQGQREVPRSAFFGDITTRLLEGTPLSRFATRELTETVGRPSPEFAPISDKAFEAATRKSVEEEQKALESFRTEFKAIRPGANIQNDSEFRRGIQEIRQKSRSERDAIRTELSFNRENEFFAREERFFQNKINNLQTVLNLDLAQIQQFSQLAQMDQEILTSQFALEAGEAARFQELFGDIGEFFIRQGTQGNPLNRFQPTSVGAGGQ